MALLNTIGGGRKTPVDGFTPEQRFFLAFGQIWCENMRPEAAQARRCRPIRTRRANFRVNGVLVNMPEFQKAFSCKAGQPMVSANACRVW